MKDTAREDSEPRAPRTAVAAAPTLRDIAHTWWPLALSWLLMGAEQPALAAVLARLEDPEVHLAAFGGIVFPMALLVEAPIIMLLAASTALASDRASYDKLARFTFRAGLTLTIVHASLAFTPLYDWVLMPLLSPDERTVEPGRTGLQILSFWTWAIADRRFRQGVLIRFGHARAVGVGTMVRILTTGGMLVLGSMAGWPGIAVASSALAVGVTVEMLFARWTVAPVIRQYLDPAKSSGPPLTRARLLRFYVPLALTPFLVLAAQPVGAAAINRMPDGLASLAVWPVLVGLVFIARAPGMAYNEVVVRHASEAGARRPLGRFAWIMALATSGLLLAIAATPLADYWFERLSGLDPELARLARAGLWLAIPMPALTVAHSLYQGVLVDAHRTRAVTEAVALYFLVSTAMLIAGVLVQGMTGVSAAILAFGCGQLAQFAWLRLRVRSLVSAPVA